MGKGDRKRGRPPKDGPREPNGRIRRAKGARYTADLDTIERATIEQDPRQQVWQTRARHLGHIAADPLNKDTISALRLDMRGSVLGRWLADGKLTPKQVAAGEDYAHRRLRFRALTGLPPETPAAASYGAVRGGGADPDPEVADRARRAYTDAQAALAMHGPAVRFAMHRACVLDVAAPVHLVRIGCRALIRMSGDEDEDDREFF